MNTRLSGGDAQAGLRRLWLERSPMGIGDPEDLTGAIILLCSDAGKFIIGTDIKIDGEYLHSGPWIYDSSEGRRIHTFLSCKE